VNDLPEAVSECSILTYADDTVSFYSSSQVSTVEMKLNEELLKIERWLFSNSLFINVKKTEAICFLGPLLGLSGKNLLIYALMANKLRGFMSSPI